MQVDESKIKWRQFVSGDNESYSWIYTTYVQILYRYGLRFTSDPEIIKDCIQEVFTSLYKNRNSLITPDNIKVYLFVSVKNCLIRTLYKESFYDRELPENIQFSLESTVEEDFINNEQYANQQKMINEILALLTPRQKNFRKRNKNILRSDAPGRQELPAFQTTRIPSFPLPSCSFRQCTPVFRPGR